jgi:hypothetical protein
MTVNVDDPWVVSLNIRQLNVTAQVTTDGSSIYCPTGANDCPAGDRKKDPSSLMFRAFEQTIKLGVPKGTKGKVEFALTIQYKGVAKVPHWSKVAQGIVPVRAELKFSCTPDGDFKFERPLGINRGTFPDRNLSVDLDIYHERLNPSDTNLPGVPELEWNKWMKQLRILRIVMITRLTMSEDEDDPGTTSVTTKDESAAIPGPINHVGATGKRTAVLGRLLIELEPVDVAPPITIPGGVAYFVYFDPGSSELDKVVKSFGVGPTHQGNALAKWVRENLNSNWQVMQGLYWKKLAVHVEARASATGRGLSHAELMAYNLELSKKRRAAVVNRLKKTIAEKDNKIVLDTTDMAADKEAIGATKAPKYGVEDDFERRCAVSIDGDELKKFVNEIYKRDFGGTKTEEFRRRLGP